MQIQATCASPLLKAETIYVLEPRCKIEDEVAEWLRRLTANQLGSARVGSNPILVENFALFDNTYLKCLT